MSPKEREYFSIVVENDGKIIHIRNIELNPFDFKIRKGERIDDIFPVFYGMFPFYKDELLMEKIVFDNYSGSIYLKNEYDRINIYFHSDNNEMDRIKNTVQRHNQNKLISKLKEKSEKFLTEDILKDLGFICLEKKDKDYILSGDIPQWFKNLFPFYNYSSVIFTPEDIFPFLEIFLPKAEDLFQTEENGYIVSGLWTQFNPDREEFVMRAIALNSSGRHYLLIESITERNPQKHNDLQRSRELLLKHQKLIRSEETIRQLLKYREEFISIISHDIKSPLSGAYSLIDFLKSDENFMKKFSAKEAHLFDVIHKNLKDVLDYSEQLYEWSHLNFSDIKLNKTDINLLSLLIDVATNFSDRLLKKKVSVEYDIAEDLTVFVDEVFFKNVIQNLFTNAVKFSYQHGVITIKATDNKDFITIKFSDNGTGMTKDVMKTLFDYSTKVSTKGTEGEKGTGIGLNIVKRILDVHNANIYVDSEPGKGTTFTIEIPKN